LPSWTRTAAPATGAATFVHVVERVLVVVCNVRLFRKAKKLWRSETHYA
jgi:hypothetical protein